MQRRKLKEAKPGAGDGGSGSPVGEVSPSAGMSRRSQSSVHSFVPGRDPDWILAAASERVQGAVGDLETLIFEEQGLGPRSRTQIHDAVALMMEALQALGKAQVTLHRTPDFGASLLNGPLAQA